MNFDAIFLMHWLQSLENTIIFWPFQVYAFIVIPSCLMFVFLVVLVTFPIVYVRYIWNTESPPICERIAEKVYHLYLLFSDVISCCDVFPLVYFLRIFGSDCTSSWSLPSSFVWIWHFFFNFEPYDLVSWPLIYC